MHAGDTHPENRIVKKRIFSIKRTFRISRTSHLTSCSSFDGKKTVSCLFNIGREVVSFCLYMLGIAKTLIHVTSAGETSRLTRKGFNGKYNKLRFRTA